MMGQGFGGAGMMGGGSLMMILFLVVIGFLVYLVLNKQNPNKDSYFSPSATNTEAIKIAKERLANGEISVEEFEQIKKNLLYK